MNTNERRARMNKAAGMTAMLPGLDYGTREPGRSYGEGVMEEVNKILEKLAIGRAMATRNVLRLHPGAFPSL